MTTTYSPSLRLSLIGTGDQSGTWGNTTNSNLGTLLEQAITGVVAISLTGLSSYTLTNLNGVSDDARNQTLVFNGSPSTTVSIIAPLQNKWYIITNSTSQNLTISASGGAISLTILPNTTAQCYCDAYNVSGTGSGFYSAQTSSAGNFTVNGTLSATGATDTGNLTVGGNASIGGNLIVSGSITGGTGKIVQTQSASFTAGSATNNTSPTATGFTLSITPTSTSSKILVLYSGPFYNPSGSGGVSSGNAYLTMYRNSTNLAGGTNFMADLLSDNSNLYASCSINYLDSPSTTSAITYQPYIWCDSGTGAGIFGFCYMTLLEIL